MSFKKRIVLLQLTADEINQILSNNINRLLGDASVGLDYTVNNESLDDVLSETLTAGISVQTAEALFLLRQRTDE